MTERQELIRDIVALEEYLRRNRENRLQNYVPFQKQIDFHNLSAGHPYTAVFGGNGSGKSVVLTADVSIHLTGDYPDWYDGHKFTRAPRLALASESYELSRDNAQRLLLGPPGQWGTGLIPKDRIVDIARRGGNPRNTIDTIYIRHAGGGTSELKLKAYNQGVEDWQAVAYDGIAFDEEPPLDIYEQAIQRVGRRKGIIRLAFTPEKGWTEVVIRFLREKPKGSAFLNIFKDDNPIYTKEMIELELANTRPHMRDTKRYGTPAAGEGAIYPVSDSEIICDPRPIPQHWRRGVGIDFGMRNTAICWCAYDATCDCIYVYKVYKVEDKPIPIHVAALGQSHDLPIFGDPAGSQRTPKAGETTFAIYEDHGVHIEPSDNSHGLIDAIWERMETGRLKVASTCQQWFDEKHVYAYDKFGNVAKNQDDHILDAMRYAIAKLGEWDTPGNVVGQRAAKKARNYDKLAGGW